jgi:uncharacterized protein (TIGR02145 family)
MKSRRIIRILCLGVIATSLYCCKTEEIILHGEISGIVTDTATSQPLQKVAVKLNPVNDTTSTSGDGKYLFKSLIPGEYKIEVSKPPYAINIRNVAVTSANISMVDFALHKIPYPEISPRHLDFGFDSTLKSFTIKNTGTGKLNYSLLPSQDWITVYPNIGDATTETDTFKVTINRTGLSEKKYMESIEVVSHIGQDLIRDTLYILLNGVMDQDKNYYGIVTIGSQTWLAENLNIGTEIPLLGQEQKDNGIIEKWCYDCKTYGGLYSWYEMMQYNPADSGVIGITQGICPVGWHIPTQIEVVTLSNYLGGGGIAGGKMKETLTNHWLPPNAGATNESGFTALPGGMMRRGERTIYNPNPLDNDYFDQGYWAEFWLCTTYGPPFPNTAVVFEINKDDAFLSAQFSCIDYCGLSVRCIKDPPKNK